MTLDEFIEEQKRTLDAFKEHWLQMRQKEPGHFPGELAPGEWDQQLLTFDIEEEVPASPRQVKAGDQLTRKTALLDMICTDRQGLNVVIDQLNDHEAEVGMLVESTITFSGEGAWKIPYEELTFSGQFYSPRPAPPVPPK